MKCLHHICEKMIIEIILNHFQSQKSINGKWVVSIPDWLNLLGIEQVKSWLSSLPLSVIESLLRQGISLLGSARDRDSLLGLMTICMELGIRRIGLPSYLVLDESSRQNGIVSGLPISFPTRNILGCIYLTFYIIQISLLISRAWFVNVTTAIWFGICLWSSRRG